MTPMASGHDAHDDHHDAHGHDDHGHDDHGHGADSSFWVVPPMIVGFVIAIVLIVVFGIDADLGAYHSPFS